MRHGFTQIILDVLHGVVRIVVRESSVSLLEIVFIFVVRDASRTVLAGSRGASGRRHRLGSASPARDELKRNPDAPGDTAPVRMPGAVAHTAAPRGCTTEKSSPWARFLGNFRFFPERFVVARCIATHPTVLRPLHCARRPHVPFRNVGHCDRSRSPVCFTDAEGSAGHSVRFT